MSDIVIRFKAGRDTGFFEFHKDGQGEWRWTKYRTDAKSEVLTKSTEGYKNKSDSEANARRFGFEDQWLKCEDDDWEIYQDTSSKKRWRRIASNGEKVGASHQGWKDEQECRINAVTNGMPN